MYRIEKVTDMKITKDYSYKTYERKGETLWGVYIGRKIRYTTCRTEEEARITVELLNRNPYALERQSWNQFLAQRG